VIRQPELRHLEGDQPACQFAEIEFRISAQPRTRDRREFPRWYGGFRNAWLAARFYAAHGTPETRGQESARHAPKPPYQERGRTAADMVVGPVFIEDPRVR